MFPRLLALFCLLSLFAQSSLAQQSGTALPANAPDSCPVTKPYDRPFVPPFPKPSIQRDDNFFWFGTDRLWTQLPANGTWNGLPHYSPFDPTFRQKLFFWRLGYDPRLEPQAKLTITGRRIDSAAPPLLSDKTSNGGWHGDDTFIVTGINFPTLGCWQITGHYQDDELTFVIWVSE